MKLAPCEDGDVLEDRLAAVAERRGLDGDSADRAPQLVDDERGESLAVDVIGENDDVLCDLEDPLQGGEEVLHGGDLLVGDKDVGLIESRFHAVWIGDEVRGDVTSVELHALHELRFHPDALALFDGDNAVFPDLFHDVSDDVADLLVMAGNRRDLGDLFLARDGRGDVAYALDDGGHAGFEAALEHHRVGAGSDHLHSFADDRLGEHGGGGGAVAGDVVGLAGDLAGELCAEVLEGVLELDLLGDADAVIDDSGGAELSLKDDVASAGTQGDADGVGEGVYAVFESAAGFLVEQQLFGWHELPPNLSHRFTRMDHGFGAQDRVCA